MAVRTDKDINKIIKEYARLLVNTGLHVEKIILFDSYAVKKANENSDIDLAVVLRDSEEDKFATRLKLMKLCRNFEEVIEPHPFLSTDFNDTNPFASEILKNGVTVYS